MFYIDKKNIENFLQSVADGAGMTVGVLKSSKCRRATDARYIAIMLGAPYFAPNGGIQRWSTLKSTSTAAVRYTSCKRIASSPMLTATSSAATVSN